MVMGHALFAAHRSKPEKKILSSSVAMDTPELPTFRRFRPQSVRNRTTSRIEARQALRACPRQQMERLLCEKIDLPRTCGRSSFCAERKHPVWGRAGSFSASATWQLTVVLVAARANLRMLVPDSACR